MNSGAAAALTQDQSAARHKPARRIRWGRHIEGYLIISRENERFYPLRLERDLCFFVERLLWALDATLVWDVGMLPGSRGSTNISLVRVAGEGMVALRVAGELVAVKVSPERPHRAIQLRIRKRFSYGFCVR